MKPLSHKRLPQYVLGSLYWSATRWRDVEGKFLERALMAYRAAVGQGHFHLPFFMIVDLAMVLERGFQTPFASDRQFTQWPEAERGLRLRYEREVPGRLLQAPGVSETIEALTHSPFRTEQLARLLLIVLQPLAPCWPAVTRLNPAALRHLEIPGAEQLTPPALASHCAEFDAQAKDNQGFQDSLRSFLQSVSETVRWGRLLQDEDIFELNHWEALSTDHLRIGCRQIIEANRRLGALDKHAVAIIEPEADTETAFVDETHYPMGGLAELTNRGSFENLVLSELIYMEKGKEISLFDLRFVEGELLFYVRDEGALRRKRRTIHLILDLGDAFTVKSRGHDYQFCILAQSLFLRVLTDLFTVFEHDAVQGVFHYLDTGGGGEDIAGEAAVMRVLLADAVSHGLVDFRMAASLGPENLREPKRKVYTLVMTMGREAFWHRLFQENPELNGLTLPIGADRGGKSEERANPFRLPLDRMDWGEWVELKNRIVRAVAGQTVTG
ncbi:MAG: hypothetical protein RLY93_10510 [Sumerlaeia bacterium]